MIKRKVLYPKGTKMVANPEYSNKSDYWHRPKVIYTLTRDYYVGDEWLYLSAPHIGQNNTGGMYPQGYIPAPAHSKRKPTGKQILNEAIKQIREPYPVGVDAGYEREEWQQKHGRLERGFDFPKEWFRPHKGDSIKMKPPATYRLYRKEEVLKEGTFTECWNAMHIHYSFLTLGDLIKQNIVIEPKGDK